ncbi:MAG: hypothetical protein HFE49_08205 [Clostridia bacterium]|nr:hypothetical protein [Clostridia bacterium]
MASAFYAHSTDLLVKAGNALGKDMSEYEELYENIVKIFKQTFTNIYYTDRMCARIVF